MNQFGVQDYTRSLGAQAPPGYVPAGDGGYINPTTGDYLPAGMQIDPNPGAPAPTVAPTQPVMPTPYPPAPGSIDQGYVAPPPTPVPAPGPVTTQPPMTLPPASAGGQPVTPVIPPGTLQTPILPASANGAIPPGYAPAAMATGGAPRKSPWWIWVLAASAIGGGYYWWRKQKGQSD